MNTPLSHASWGASERRQLLWFFLIALLILAAGMGLRDPWPADEPRFTLVAKQMVESGDWLITHRGSEVYSDKPPMFMILQALAYKLTGHWRIAFLLPSLLASLGSLLLIYDLGRRLWNHRTGLWAAAALLVTFQFVYQAKRAQIDPTVTFFITLANYGLLRHFLLGPNWRAYWLGCFAAGLGVITKGVGVLAFLMFVPYVLARWRGWNHLAPIPASGWRWAGGALAFLIAVSLWLGPMLLTVLGSDRPDYHAYLQDILFRQTAGRYTDSWDHHKPFWYYLGVIAFSWLPLSLLLPAMVSRWRERWHARDARFLLPLLWIVLVIVFFSFPKGKRDVYIMPALPWMALMVAPFLAEMVQRLWLRRTLLIFVSALAVIFLGVGAAAWMGHLPAAERLVEERGLDDAGRGLWMLLLAIGTVAALSALWFRQRRSLAALAVTMSAIWLLWSFYAYPLLNSSTSASGVMQKAGAIMGSQGELGMVGWKEQNLLLADRKAVDFGFLQPTNVQLGKAILWQRAAPQNRWVFILDEAMDPCIDRDLATRAGHANRREWWLFRHDAVRAGCANGDVTASKARTDSNDY